MREHRRAQVVHHALADLVRDPRLRHADHAVDDRQRDHAADQPRSSVEVVPDDALVDRFAQQERRGDAEHRAEHDQPQQQPQTHPIGDEQPPDAAQRHVFVGDVLGAEPVPGKRRDRRPSLPPCPGLKGWALTALTLPSPS